MKGKDMYLTIENHRWNPLLVNSLYLKLSSGGIMFGYCFVFCASISSAVSRGPKVLRGPGFRAGCDGGRNLSGFSNTNGRSFDLSAVSEA